MLLVDKLTLALCSEVRAHRSSVSVAATRGSIYHRRSLLNVAMALPLLVMILAAVTCAQQQPAVSSTPASPPGEFGCHCMEYWKCVMGGGNPHSYCGLSESSVCCFVPPGAHPLPGLFAPVVGSSKNAERQEPARCGRKGAKEGPAGVAVQGEWPWHAAILEQPGDLYVCGASLLDQSWVVTAAHCVDDYAGTNGASQLAVRLGEFDVTSANEALAHEERRVAEVVLHPGFDNRSLAHDVALLRLRTPATRRPHVDVVCLPRRDQDVAGVFRNCVITGWGRRSEVAEHSVTLKEVPVPLWEQRDCEKALKQRFGPAYSLPDTAICAGAEGRDACDGDGGGPLVCEDAGQWYQVGVISFGIGCGRRETPGVYTRLSRYERWITDTILGSKLLN